MQTADERNIFLSTSPATDRDRAQALAVVGVSTLLFAIAAVYARVPLAPVPAFVASYQSALAINDLITAVLLFSQFAVLRSRALLLLASGYLFTAAAAISPGARASALRGSQLAELTCAEVDANGDRRARGDAAGIGHCSFVQQDSIAV